MKKLVIFDSAEVHESLLPLTFTRPVGALRVGIDTLAEKWEAFVEEQGAFLPVEYLQAKFGSKFDREDALYVAADVVADAAVANAARALVPGSRLVDGEGVLIAYRGPYHGFMTDAGESLQFDGRLLRVRYTYDIFRLNDEVLPSDFRRLTRGRVTQVPDRGNTVIGPMRLDDGIPALFIEEGAQVEAAIINTRKGPVYIGRDAEVMEGSCLRGPVAVCEGAHVNMGAKIYGATTIGPHCKVGGEVMSVVMTGYSNKSHDGFLGHAVIGEWCNIGAGVNASNLKNDYSKIRLWNYTTRTFMRTDLQFCGLIMGDHSKIGINCMLNTATVMGVGVNLHGCGFPRTFLPGFEEGSPTAGFKEVPMKKFIDIAERMMSRRGIALTPEDIEIFQAVRDYERGDKR